MQTSQSFLLPWPISVNAMWRAVRMGRERVANILSAKARLWSQDAERILIEQRPQRMRGPVEIDIKFCAPTKRAFDLDNRCKILLDLLVRCLVIEGDDCKILKRLTLGLGEGFVGALVTIKTWED